ncbi:MBL fold metallo-hydrolase [Solibacillus sp. CAU 1738]|uniref:MBL fold metallo-hydrolase n=1 Tax=Solibacillus sp. CAU 1738 TaxID=3140363 RepID=UPI003261018B
MLLKKSFEQGEKNGVIFGNGIIKFQAINLNVYSYIVDGVCIDTGARSLRNLFRPFYEQQNIEQIVLTHYHEDHSGNAAYFQKKGIPILMNQIMLESCTKRADYPLYRKLFWGAREPFHGQPLESTFESRNATWDVIETPGHAIDHVALLNRETGHLFTGDLYVSSRTKVVLKEESIPTIIASLEKVLTYDFNEVFCSHAGLLKDGRQRLTVKRDYLLELEDKVIAFNKLGFSAAEIQKQLFPKKYPITRMSSGEWNSMNIVTSILEEKKKI